MKLKSRELGSLFLLFIGYYVLTRKKYELPDISVFIPNTNLLSQNQYQVNQEDIKDKILQSIDFKFVTDPDIGWLVTIKPIYGINIPFKILLPWDVFIAIPQIKEEIGKNIVIKRETFGGMVLGYKIHIKNAYFWA